MAEGLVTVDEFNKACVKFGVILRQAEVAKLLNPNGFINYVHVSRELGLHNKNVEAISKNVLKNSISQQDLERVFARRGSGGDRSSITPKKPRALLRN